MAAGEKAFGATRPAKSVGNVTLSRDGSGRLWAIYGVIQQWKAPLFGNLCRNWLCGRVDGKTSTDEGDSWSPAMRLDDQVGALPRARPLHLPDGRDVLPLYREGERTAHLLVVDLARQTRLEKATGEVWRLPRTG